MWRYASNCILVKKYSFFTDTGDINDPHAFKVILKSLLRFYVHIQNTKPSTKTKNAEKELPDKKVPDEPTEDSKENEDGNTPPGTPPPEETKEDESSLGTNFFFKAFSSTLLFLRKYICSILKTPNSRL